MIYLDFREYAKIVSEINTKDKRVGIHLSYGIDNKAYAYVFEIHGFNEYTFIARDEFQ